MLRDIEAGKDAQIGAVVELIARADADLLLLTGIDYDYDLAALGALNARLDDAGAGYAHRFAFRPNTGWATGLDLDRDGKLGGPGDALGYGRFAGEGGMAVLSRLPLDTAAARDMSTFLWRDLPQAQLPQGVDAPFYGEAELSVLRLATTGFWDVPVSLPDGSRLHLLAYHATPPVFDGPEDRNGLRNHDEAAFWVHYLNGALPFAPPDGPVMLVGDANLDVADGDGRPEALLSLLTHPRLQDQKPRSDGGVAAADPEHQGDPGLDTAQYDGPGSLRVDYILPDATLDVADAGVIWPLPGDPLAEVVATASRHRLVWVDLVFDR